MTYIALLALATFALAAKHRQAVPEPELHPQDASSWSCPTTTFADSPAVTSLQQLGAQLWEEAWKTGNTRRELRKIWGRKLINVKFPGSVGYGLPPRDVSNLSGYPSYMGFTVTKAIPLVEKERVRVLKFMNDVVRGEFTTKQLDDAGNRVFSDADVNVIMAEVLECRANQPFHYRIWEFGTTLHIMPGHQFRVERRFAFVSCGDALNQMRVGLYMNSATAIRSGFFPNTEAYDFLSHLLVDNFYRTLSEQCTKLPGLEEETSTTTTALEVDHEWTEGYAQRRANAGLPN